MIHDAINLINRALKNNTVMSTSVPRKCRVGNDKVKLMPGDNIMNVMRNVSQVDMLTISV